MWVRIQQVRTWGKRGGMAFAPYERETSQKLSQTSWNTFRRIVAEGTGAEGRMDK